MLDKGHKITDDELKKLERKLTKEYKQASKEVTQKLESHLSRFETKDKLKLNELKAEKITEEEYKQWRVGQMMMGKRWEEMKQTLAEDLTNVNQIAMSMVKETLPDVYALNHNYGTFEVEKGSQIDTSYTLYDRQTVETLAKENPKLLPDPKVNIPKDVRWNKQSINSAVLQGVLQGEDVRRISKRMVEVTDMNRKGAIRNARTIYTGVENRARRDSYERALDFGIDMEQTWVATLDGRTRESHRWLDGETRPIGEEFSNGLEYPGDPSGDPREVYNCRCTLIGNVAGFRRDLSDLSKRNTTHMMEDDYDDWKRSKSTSKKTWESVKHYEKRVYKGRNGKLLKVDLQFFASRKDFSEYEQIYLDYKEYAKVMHNLRTHATDEEREDRIFQKAIGDYIYSVLYLPKDEEYIIIDKKLNKG